MLLTNEVILCATIRAGGPPYGGALDWLQKHQDYLNQSLKYVQRYPNLIQVNLQYVF